MINKDTLITVIVIIVVIWIAGVLFKILGMLIHALLPVAVILLVVYFIMRWRENEQDKDHF